MTISNQSLFKSIGAVALATLALLLIPFIAMQVTHEVNWTISDFIFAGLLLFGTGASYFLITHQSQKTKYKFGVAVALGSGLFLIWSNAAVGLIGSEDNIFNLWFFGVILVGIVGTFVSKLKASGLERTMYAMTIGQALLMVIALMTGMQYVPHSSVMEIVAVNGFFMTLYLVAGLLFRGSLTEE
jgi:predicted membrane channel-forming protein YqfA (hemolysin III family)